MPPRLRDAVRARPICRDRRRDRTTPSTSRSSSRATGDERTIAWRDTVVRDADGRRHGDDEPRRRHHRAPPRPRSRSPTSPTTTRSPGCPTARCCDEHLDLALARARRAGRGGRAAVPRPRRLQARQRLARPRRPATSCCAGRRAAARAPPRRSTCSARQGGDEFLLLLGGPGPTRRRAPREARRPSDRCRRWPSRSRSPARSSRSARSIGISLFPRDADDADELLRHADAAMYEAKAAGRGGVAVYDGDPRQPLERLSMTSRLRTRAGPRRARPALAADRRPARRRAARARGARALAGPDPRPGPARRVHPVRRGDRPRSTASATGCWAPSARPGAARGRARARPPRVTSTSRRASCAAPDFGERLLEARRAPTASRRAPDAWRSPSRPRWATPTARRPGARRAGRRRACESRSTTSAPATRRCRGCGDCRCRCSRSTRRSCGRSRATPQATAIVAAIIELVDALGLEAVAEGVESEAAARRFLRRPRLPRRAGLPAGPPGARRGADRAAAARGSRPRSARVALAARGDSTPARSPSTPSGLVPS